MACARRWDTTLMRPGTRLIAVVVAATAVSALSGASNARASIHLCGILDPLDRLLHCSRPAGAAGSDAPAAAAAASGPAATSTRRAPLATTAPTRVPATPQFVPNLLIVRFRPGITGRAQAEALAGVGASVDHRIRELGVVVARVPPARREQALARLAGSSAVAGVERDVIVHALDTTPNDPNWPDQWGLQRIGLSRAWDRTRGGHLTVAVLDSGVDAEQPDLQG